MNMPDIQNMPYSEKMPASEQKSHPLSINDTKMPAKEKISDGEKRSPRFFSMIKFSCQGSYACQ